MLNIVEVSSFSIVLPLRLLRAKSAMAKAILVVFVLVLITVIGRVKSSNLNGRIVGGTETSIAKYPYMVSLKYKTCAKCYHEHVCGGTILNEHTILTAAHCLYTRSPKDFLIVAGTNYQNGKNGYVMIPDSFHLHEDFNPALLDNDVALILFDIAIPLNNYTTATVHLTHTRPSVGTSSVLIGWGAVSESGMRSVFLRETTVPVDSQDHCISIYGETRITDSVICVGRPEGGSSSCSYDAGGPVLVNGQQVGIIAWGAGCGRPGYPEVSMSVFYYRAWIEKNLNKKSYHN